MNHIISPQANAAVAEWFGEAPSNKKSCALTAASDHCSLYHASDEAYFRKVWYWTTPTKTCLDGRGPIRKDYSEWCRPWTGEGVVGGGDRFAETAPRQTLGRRLSTFFFRQSWLRASALLAAPLGWLLIAYFAHSSCSSSPRSGGSTPSRPR